MIDKFIEYLEYPFVRYALIVGVLIALCSSLLGVTLVLKRFSFIGDGLSHVAFGAMGIASVLKLTSNVYFVMPVTIIAAIFLLRANKEIKINGDAIIATVSVASLALGYLLMNVFKTGPNVSGDVCTTLFGSTSILTLSKTEVSLSIILSIIVVGIFILLYNKLFAITFDEEYMKASGLKVELYNTLIAVFIAIIVVLSMNLVGSLLIAALIVFPPLSSMMVFKSFKAVTISSGILSVICALMGMIASILLGTPVGATIVIVDMLAFIIFFIIGRARG
ncbi:MAG: iron chelate uptake ABC transporter family permease subunit [Ezakiella sp.]|nr:metal ABC transporter permease [Ezakiella sp.]MDY3947110.1 iron chelate uptake ABC transporter family permease subunit [Ezakiella sp.]